MKKAQKQSEDKVRENNIGKFAEVFIGGTDAVKFCRYYITETVYLYNGYKGGTMHCLVVHCALRVWTLLRVLSFGQMDQMWS